MILVDTNVWADHLGKPDPRLTELLNTQQVHTHAHVIGELALGNLPQYALFIRYLQHLPSLRVASDAEVLALVQTHKLSGSGIGYSDAHLIASLFSTEDMLLWTRDKRLNTVAHRFGRAWTA